MFIQEPRRESIAYLQHWCSTYNEKNLLGVNQQSQKLDSITI